MKRAFGVDFGSHTTSVTYIDARGDTLCEQFPSVLNLKTKSIGSFQDSPESSVMRMKRALNLSYSAADALSLLRVLHYDTIIPDEKNDIVFKVGEDEQLTLRQTVATFIKLALDKTRAKAGEVYKDCNRVSITYPASYFTTDVDFIKNAFATAALEVVSAVSEPVAAAVHELTTEGSQVHLKENARIFTFDMGGGTLDLTIMQKNVKFGDTPRGFTVECSGGAPRLGGFDIDVDVVKLLKGRAKDLSDDDKAWIQDPQNAAALLYRAEKVKRQLSHKTHTHAQLGGSLVKVTRADLNQACSATIDKILQVCREFLEREGFKAEEIDALSLIGGGTQVPEIKAKLFELFPHLQPRQVMDKDYATAVSQGALKMVLTGTSQLIELTDCTPMEFGVRMWHVGRKSIDDMYLWITFAIEAGKKLPVVDAVIWALVPNEPHVWINIPIYECKDIKKDGDPKSIANSEFGVVKILNDNNYKAGTKIKILLGVSVSREITVDVVMANGDKHEGVLKKRGDRELMEKLKDKNTVTDFLEAGPPQHDDSVPPTEPQLPGSQDDDEDDGVSIPEQAPKKSRQRKSEAEKLN